MPYLPGIILGLILTAYWGRVLRLTWKVRKSTGHSAHFRPPEPLGRCLRFLWVPIILIWIIHPYFTAFTQMRTSTNPFIIPHSSFIIQPLFTHPLLAWPATTLAALAFWGTLICWKRMGKSWRMGIDPNERTQLVITGPYAYVRHPIYALSSILMLATMAAIPSPLMLAAGLCHLLLLQWEATREERYLLSHHGDAYAQYCLRAGRFFPRLLTRGRRLAESP